MPWKADKVGLDREAFRQLHQLDTQCFVDDPNIARKELQRFVDVFGA